MYNPIPFSRINKLNIMLKDFHVPKAVNEPVKGYAPNSPEKQPFKQLIQNVEF
jgi:hypothetical protein